MRAPRPLVVAIALTAILGSPLIGFTTETCTGNVVIGEGATQVSTGVPNSSFDDKCFNAWILDTDAEGANYGSQVEFIASPQRLVITWTKAQPSATSPYTGLSKTMRAGGACPLPGTRSCHQSTSAQRPENVKDLSSNNMHNGYDLPKAPRG